MKYLLPVLLLACVDAFAQPISSPTEYRPQIFDITAYELNLEFRNPSTKEAKGRCDIILTWTESAEAPSLPIHLRNLKIDSVQSDGIALTFAHQGIESDDTFHIRIDIGKPVSANVSDTISVWYSGRMTTEGSPGYWGGVFYDDEVLFAMGVGFHNPSVSATQFWMPCYDHPSDKATLKATFWVPKDLSVASVGTLIAADLPLDDELHGFTWIETHETATYLFTYAVGNFELLDLGDVFAIPHVVYTQEKYLEDSRITYKLLPEMSRLFVDLYGEYPFDKVGYVNTTKGAMEHQTMVTMAVSNVRKRDTANTTVAHELSHQWFGDFVTPLDFRHAWLTEAFATYSEAAWVEHLYGHGYYLQTLENGIKSYTQSIAQREGVMSLYDFPRASPSSNYPETIYRKGQLVLAMARLIAGDDAFYSALRSYLNAHKYGTATTDDAREAFRPALGALTDDFFDQWVLARGWPRLAIDLEPDHSSWTARIIQVQEGQGGDWPLFTALPLEITYHDPITDEPKDTVIIMTSREVSIEIASPNDFQINSGRHGRSLLEVASITTVMEPRVDRHGVVVTPNPSHDSATITRTSSLDAARIDIFNASGQTMVTAILVHEEPSVTVNIADWPSGVYMVRVVNDYSITAVSMVVQR